MANPNLICNLANTWQTLTYNISDGYATQKIEFEGLYYTKALNDHCWDSGLFKIQFLTLLEEGILLTDKEALNILQENSWV